MDPVSQHAAPEHATPEHATPQQLEARRYFEARMKAHIEAQREARLDMGRFARNESKLVEIAVAALMVLQFEKRRAARLQAKRAKRAAANALRSTKQKK